MTGTFEESNKYGENPAVVELPTTELIGNEVEVLKAIGLGDGGGNTETPTCEEERAGVISALKLLVEVEAA